MNLAKNKSALITGASSGIGKATALAFAKAGIDVALVSRSQEKLAAVASAVEQTGVKAIAYPLDLADVEQVREKISAIAADTKVDILVNSAGMGYTGNLSETPLGDWQAVMNLNLTSVFQCILGALPTMRDRGTGTIINIASIAGLQPFPSWGAYSVSKAGLIALSKTLAAEERTNGIRVTTICPGAVDTELWNSDTVGIKLERSAMLTPESVAQSILHTVLLPKQAVIEELTLMPNAGVL
ncbi:SDR family oxidoreductase [Gloeocapsopsis dulcis]|uniref:Short-chain dehydrogenase n=1 Tax=Gloeocapsopsis dulcis AAB1 = 1H9 TaxID=1433147 RepID=A0A6N8FXT1_9CHRO|nr:SDR family oxidoreductase [Gloeocapsopsis dulcis]MUL37574.1 short-chain dehydrogenase [Gloeocapsopsis dulcis AAB1 = 1H9]WNN87986.1 SDR family oxidoreductase [Gloeocapsopsis dulcis]